MKYFTDNFNRRGTCYHEFSRGKWDGKTFWSDESLYLHDDYMVDLELAELVFKRSFEKFNDCDENKVTREIWEHMLSLAEDIGGEVRELFFEVAPWVEKNFSEYDEFWILGI